MPKAKLSDAQAIPDQSTTAPQGGTAKLSDATPVPEKYPVVDKWNTLSRNQKDNYFQSLPAAEQERFASRVGLFNSQEPVNVSAPPAIGSIPWMKQKAYALANWGANQIPNVEGSAGGLAGGLLGEVVNPAGGGVIGALAGSAIGGASGEHHRQKVVDAFHMDPYASPVTPGQHLTNMAVEAGKQMGAEALGMGIGKILRPTLERSIAKLYYAGNLKHGDPLGPGDLERVMNDLVATEKQSGKAVTVRDLYDTIHHAKNDIGQEVDLQYALPTQQNGRTVLLGQYRPNPGPIINAINSKFSSSPSVTVLSQINPAGPEAAYLQRLKNEALNYSKHNWTYSELADRRIHLNEEIGAIYALPPGEKRVAMLASPDLAYKKAEVDAIRDITYPEMDRLANQPKGTTQALQEKRGALMSLENQVHEHLGNIKTKAKQAQGAPPLEKTNISTYGTSSGKPGFGVHRLQGLVHTPNPEAKADKQVARAFGNTVPSKIRKAVSSPFGEVHGSRESLTTNDKVGNQLLSLPLRMLIHHPSKFEPALPPEEEEGTPEPQSSVTRPKDLIERAKQLNPAAQGQPDYTHIAVNPATGHKIGSNGGAWFDLQTGAKVA